MHINAAFNFYIFTPIDEEDFKKLNSVWTFSCVNNIIIWGRNLDF